MNSSARQLAVPTFDCCPRVSPQELRPLPSSVRGEQRVHSGSERHEVGARVCQAFSGLPGRTQRRGELSGQAPPESLHPALWLLRWRGKPLKPLKVKELHMLCLLYIYIHNILCVCKCCVCRSKCGILPNTSASALSRRMKGLSGEWSSDTAVLPSLR